MSWPSRKRKMPRKEIRRLMISLKIRKEQKEQKVENRSSLLWLQKRTKTKPKKVEAIHIDSLLRVNIQVSTDLDLATTMTREVTIKMTHQLKEALLLSATRMARLVPHQQEETGKWKTMNVKLSSISRTT